MDDSQESAAEYAQRHGLFHTQRNDMFLPQNCVDRVQNCIDNLNAPLLELKSTINDLDIPANALLFEEEPFTADEQDGPEVTLQTPLTYGSNSMASLLLELPDMGYEHRKTLTKFLNINLQGFLATQYLPLLSIDSKRDKGLTFPPHIDRLHQALVYKVESEKLTVAKQMLVGQSSVTSKVFSVDECPVTPPQSPIQRNEGIHDGSLESESKSASTEKSNEAWTEENNSSLTLNTGLSSNNELLATYSTDSTAANGIQEKQIKQVVGQKELTKLGQDLVVSPPQASNREPSPSFFDDAFFGSDAEEDNNTDLQNMASTLDRIDSLLIPMPNVQDSEMRHVAPDEPSQLSRLRWNAQMRLPPLDVDVALEESLPWAPLPRRNGSFEEENLMGKDSREISKSQLTNDSPIGPLGSIQDLEVEEISEFIPPAKIKQPNSLDALIQQRLQRSKTGASAHSAAEVSSPNLRGGKPILPSTSDPGATSKLVSAYMTLRGVKRTRSDVK